MSAGALMGLVERGFLPDALVRAGIRGLLEKRLQDDVPDDPEEREAARRRVMREMEEAPVAVATEAANEQHYEVPPGFYELVLGRHLKYSSCYYPTGEETLDAAEAAMLELTASRARLADGQDVLELGCGWGSLTLWMAERFPSSRITAVSNSAPQRRFIEGRAARRGVENLRVVTADMNDFRPEGSFDRVVSVEMFEHMRNWRTLLDRVADWLRPGGLLFLHVFCHREVPYFFEDEGSDDWMARHFFTGGLMPSLDLPERMARRLEAVERWPVSGVHYQRTARQWLERLDGNRGAVHQLFSDVYGARDAARWIQRWRLFFMSCEELFGYRGGDEWLVSHTLLRKPAAP